MREEEKINLEKIKKAQMDKELFAKILSDSDDEEVKKRREKEEKRKKMLQMLDEKAKEVRNQRR